MSVSGDKGPSALRFSQILRRLVGAEDSRSVIRLVERWLEHGSVSQTARIAQARALMDLRLMDRAWVRLREASEADPGSMEVQLLTAEMYIERGWPGKASPILDHVLMVEMSDAYRRWWERLKTDSMGPPKAPPPNAAEIERSGTAEQVMHLAEQYLSVGSLVRAESLLQRLTRDGFTPPRVSDLLWAVRGDFVSSKMPTDAFLDELGGDEWVSDLSGIEFTEGLIPDDTAQVVLSDTEQLLTVEARRRAFPRLFRQDESTGETTTIDEDEVTLSSMLVSIDEDEEGTGDSESELTPMDGSGDTRIMEVIPHGDRVRVNSFDGALHRGRSTVQPVDLKVHRAAFLPPDDEVFLEDEDKDLIIMTRREEPKREAAPPRDEPVEVLKRPGPILATPETRRTPTRSGGMVHHGSPKRGGASARDSALPGRGTLSEPSTDERVVPPRWGRWGNIGATLSGIALLMVVVAWLMVLALHWIAQDQIIQETHDVVAAADFRGIQELEAKLEGQIKAGRSPTDVRLVELALVQTILWYQYTGDSDRMNSAQDVLEAAREAGAPAGELALVTGYLRLAMGDQESAETVIEGLDMDLVLHRDLTARVALGIREDAESQRMLKRLGPVQSDTPLMELMSREHLLTALDDVVGATPLRKRLMEDHGNSPFVQIARFHEQWDGDQKSDVLEVLDDVMESIPGPVAPRQEGRLHAQRAFLLMERGDLEAAERSWSSALVIDPTHSSYLRHAASKRLQNNEIIAALDEFGRCLGSRPWDYGCRRGMIQALIELDRLETARQFIEAWGESRTGVLQAWVELAAGNPELAVAGVESEGGALAAWVRGMAMADLESPMASAALGRVIAGWSDVSEPMTQILVGRARVTQALIEQPLEETEALAREWAPTDPVAWVLVARKLETAGQRASAEALYQAAVEIGPESATALYALGLFWFDPRASFESARTVWRQYLDLQPSGDRARRTRARMGRR
jgi:Tfp pilus assembly protein PilF